MHADAECRILKRLSAGWRIDGRCRIDVLPEILKIGAQVTSIGNRGAADHGVAWGEQRPEDVFCKLLPE